MNTHLSRWFGLVGGFALSAGTAGAALVGHWTFDNQDLTETSEFRVAGTHDGVVAAGTVAYSTDSPFGGYSLDLTGGDNAVLVQNSNLKTGGSQNLGNNPDYVDTFDTHLNTAGTFTVAVWVKGWGLGDEWEPFVSKKGEDNYGYQLRRHSGSDNAAFTIRGTDGLDDPQGGINVNDGGWHHLAGVWDRPNGNRYLYVDGVLDTDGSILDGTDINGMANASYEYMVFGARDNGGIINDFSKSLLDDIRVYDTALTQQQVQLLIPEPSSVALVGLAATLLGVRRRRRA